jgi:hypothetical protein
MLSMAYPLTFTVRPFVLAGRETRAHSAAVVGAALVVGVILYLLIAMAERIRLKALVPIGLAGLFSLLVGFGFAIQQDYRQAWQFQRDFWTKLLPLIQDVSQGTVILVDNAGLSEPAQIQANTWNLPRTLHQIYTFPDEWDGKHPCVFRLSGGWENTLVSPEHPHLVHISAETVQSPSAFYQDINSDNVILINTNEGVFTRHFTPLDLDGVTVVFKTQGDQVLHKFPTGFLYPYLSDPEK